MMAEIEEGLLLPPEKVVFKSSDGLNLNGYFYPNPQAREAILICHGFHGAAADLHLPALTLQNQGYNILTFDFRSCGASEGRTTSGGFWEVKDVLGALAYLKSRPEIDPDNIGLYGFSMGGAAAIMATALSPEVRALVTDSAFASLDDLVSSSFKHFFGVPRFPFATPALWFTERFAKMDLRQVKPYQALQEMRLAGRSLPVLLIHGEQDHTVPVSQALKLYAAAPEPKQLWLVAGSGHVVAQHTDSTEYETRICDFFNTYLKVPTKFALRRFSWGFAQAD
jgi:dipeptidyl aminopeptidase/acylaminoacyl peptidase